MTARPSAHSLVQLRDLVWTLVRTDFKVRYRGALSGFGWALLKPLIMFLVLYGVFSFLFRDHDYLYALLIGLVLFHFFSEATSVGLEAIYSKGFLLTKSTFPRWIVVVTSMVNATITLLVTSAAVVVVLLRSSHPPDLVALGLFAAYLVSIYLIVLGFSLGSSVLFLQYRDLNQIWDVVLRAGFFVAPVMYPIDVLPERYHFLLYLWPPTPIIQFSRQALVMGQIPTWKAHILLLTMTLVFFFGGLLLFVWRLPRAMEKL